MQHELAGKVAVVTGGGRGIGAAIAARLAAMGTAIAIAGRNLKQLQATAQQITAQHGSCAPMICDVTDLASVESFAAAVLKKFNQVDILVNNAGIGGFGGPLHKLPPAAWDSILNTNLRGVFYCIRGFTPLMLERGGHIVNISSLAGKNALPGGAAY